MEISPEILNDLTILMTVMIGGTVAIVAFLGLATLWSSRSLLITMRLVAGAFCASIYLMLAVRFSLNGPIIIFLSALIAEPLQVLFLRSLGFINKQFRWWIPYVVWLYLWVTALIGWRYGWLGLLTITLPAILIAGLGFFFIAGFLLPFPKPDLYRGKRPAPVAGGVPKFSQEIQDLIDLLLYPENRKARKEWIEQRRKALCCLVTYALGTNRSYYVVIDEKISERTGGDLTWLTEEEKLIQRVDGAIYGEFLAGPGIVLTGCDQAVVLSSGQKFKGAKGPGVIFTGYADVPTQVVDLRVQLRAFPVRAWTKDGIEIEVFTFTPFQIGTGKEKPELGKGFPYRSGDVFKAVHAQLMEHVDLSQAPENMEKQKWYDLPKLAGERIVREIISRYTFDELYAPFELYADPSQDPRFQIAGELRNELEKILPDWGLQRSGSGISNLVPVDKRVIEQRVEAWRADWTRKIMLKQAAGQFKRLQLVEQARAQAQIDIILAIGKRLERLRVAGTPVPMDTVARYFIEVLETLAEKSALHQLLPGDTGDVIQRARRTIGKEPASVEGEQTNA